MGRWLTAVFVVFVVISFSVREAVAGPGDLDPTFDGDGKVITSLSPSSDIAFAVSIQSDGKIVLAGSCFNGADNDFCLARYNPNGSLDTSFDADGKVITPLDASNDTGSALAIQSDGKILVAGSCFTGSTNDFCLARYNPNGNLDTSFDGDGKIFTPTGGGRGVAIQSDGKIIVAGSCSGDFCLARYNPNGSPDASFGSDGKVITPTNGGGLAVAIQSDGKIIVAGSCFSGSGVDFCMARYNSNGSLDTSFNADGKVITPLGSPFAFDTGSAVAIQSDGKIVLAGSCITGFVYDFCVVRYNSDGSLDTSFDGDGNVITHLGSPFSFASAFGVKIQSDGKIVVAGSCQGNFDEDFCLARYNPNGSLDTSFDGDGKVITPIGTAGDVGWALAIQSDGKIVVAGSCDGDFCVARFGVTDSDGDGVSDALDQCPGTTSSPVDPNGCSQSQVDQDLDGICNPSKVSTLCNGSDNCPSAPNPGQTNNDGDGTGDACDPDDDNDGVADVADNCVLVANADQVNSDGDGLGNACDPDDDNDGLLDALDACPLIAPRGGLDADLNGCSDTLGGLVAIVQGLTFDSQAKNGLLGKLYEALEALDRGNFRVAQNKVGDFIDQVNGLRTTKLSTEQANLLTSYASNLLTLGFTP
jgi:uncharacterized delta-60 repeat protein